MQYKRFLGGLAALLLLAGGGCSSADTPANKADDGSSAAAPTEQLGGASAEAIMLRAEPTSADGEVYLSWDVPTSLASDDGYRIVRANEPEPAFPGNYWFHQDEDRRHITWINIPDGTHYFRVCQFMDGACKAYSNEVEVRVGNKTIGTATEARSEEETIRKFYDGLMSANKETALQYVPASVQSASFFKKKWAKIKDWQYQNVEIRIDTITGDGYSKKQVDVVLGIKIDNKLEVGTDQITIDYREGTWWVVDFPA